jgi:hypothetical protein
MNVSCPQCGRVIEAANINVEKDFALCAACNNIFSLSEFLSGASGKRHASETVPGILKEPPRGVWKREYFDTTVIGATTRSPIAFFLVPFALVWSGGSVGILYGTQLVSGKFNLAFSLFGLPFLIGSLLLFSGALMALAGKIEVWIGRESFVFHGVGRLGIKKRFDWSSVTSIYEGMPSFGVFETSRGRAIFIEGATRIKFGGGLTEERKYYMVTALKCLHEKSL